MFSLKNLFVTVLLALCCHTAFGQTDFCDAITAIIRDAPNKFRNTRGKQLEANVGATFWACGIKVPGTIDSRFAASMGLFYEGAFYQSPTTDGLKEAYEKYKSILSACLIPKGYKLSGSDNFYPGLSAFKKVVFMEDISGAVKPGGPPPHVAMEVTYNKDLRKYTIVLFIYEH